MEILKICECDECKGYKMLDKFLPFEIIRLVIEFGFKDTTAYYGSQDFYEIEHATIMLYYLNRIPDHIDIQYFPHYRRRSYSYLVTLTFSKNNIIVYKIELDLCDYAFNSYEVDIYEFNDFINYYAEYMSLTSNDESIINEDGLIEFPDLSG